jgi:hypothetical protein
MRMNFDDFVEEMIDTFPASRAAHVAIGLDEQRRVTGAIPYAADSSLPRDCRIITFPVDELFDQSLGHFFR